MTLSKRKQYYGITTPTDKQTKERNSIHKPNKQQTTLTYTQYNTYHNTYTSAYTY